MSLVLDFKPRDPNTPERKAEVREQYKRQAGDRVDTQQTDSSRRVSFSILRNLLTTSGKTRMKSPLILVATTVAIFVTSSYGQNVDNTVVAGAFGTQVVNAVVHRIRSRCIFSDDRLYLRRAAYVTSRDGADPMTYRPGYDGGIWQVDKSQFEATRNCPAAISSACTAIQTELGINWRAVTWSDLRQPLASGLAAALYTILQLNGQAMPGNVTDQAQIWARITGGQADTYITNAPQATRVVCTDKMDLAFLLDASGSVSYPDFELMLRFAADVVDIMDVSPNVVRVADVVFSTGVKIEFDFDDYSGKDNLRSRILSTTKEDSGTNTALGLDQTAQLLYDTSRGARNNAKKVTVLVTDGQSNSFTETVASAKALKDKGTTLFTVGVGGYKLQELQAVASTPNCSHVFTLPDFSVIQSILTEIQKSACEASLVFTENKPIREPIPPEGSEKTTETKTPDSHKTVEAAVSCGILDIYVSTTDTKPGPAVYQEKYQATDGSPASVTLVETLPAGTTVYITVVGTRLPASVAALKNCTDFSWSLGVVPKRNVTVRCAENGVPRPCTAVDVAKAGLCGQIETKIDYPVDNPCTQDSISKGIMRYPYPYDPTKFLQCDMRGNVYVTSCPKGVVFNNDSLECGFTAPGGGSHAGGGSGSASGSGSGSSSNSSSGSGSGSGGVSASPLPGGYSNPCTVQALMNRNFYHTYSPDKKKFIQCDEWGKAWLMPCGPNTEWSQTAYTCIKIPVQGSAKCNYFGEFVANPCDHHAYFLCDAALQSQKITCPAGLFYNPSVKVCDWTDVQTTTC